MGTAYSAFMLQSGLPDVSQMMNPEAMLVTSVAVGCLGLAVMLLTRPQETELVPEGVPEGENGGPAEEVNGTPTLAAANHEPFAANESIMTRSAAEAIPPAPPEVAEAHAASSQPAKSSSIVFAISAGETSRATAVGRPTEERTAEMPIEGATRAPAMGASALIAKVSTLLPAGVASPEGPNNSATKSTRGASGSHAASRFSRSQQAFLRIPVMLTGRDESGIEFQEEACTRILLPQGAVIPMRRKVRAGERMTLSIPSRQKEVACEVFCAQPGPDGKLMVEIEFTEPQKSMWPVSFPAWAGKSSATAPASPTGRAGAPERAPALDRSDS